MLSCSVMLRLFETPRTAAHLAPLSVGFSSQEYWSGLPFPCPGDLPDPGIEPASPVSPVLQADSLPLSHRGSPTKTRQRSQIPEVKVSPSCPTLCDPMDCGQPGSSVQGILQARILEWVAIPFSRGSSQPRDGTQVSNTAADSLPNELPGKPNVLWCWLSQTMVQFRQSKTVCMIFSSLNSTVFP